ncbi:hypothetical protein N7478_001717 [Penicillium angulare]|uniref:uncharacterized protein n=1 Tax=Penicillium angulare TaxID=116970 RepID=UPI00253F9417|nr:uncharacterized protein N7478_001717 [Penicillium angulare]KAJ5288687.1 hypothetical protein N7478_001717 [Penicillium angulare]
MASSVVFGHSNSGFQIGENTGPITANFHTIIEPQEQQPEPLSTVPFPRDPDFIHRGSLVDHIHEKCSGPESVVVLMGLGGVGKSQIAIEYSFRVREESPTTWVFWVHASNAARFEQSFWRIANRTKIPGRQDPASNIFEIVCGWLQDLKERWVMIIDNADDDEFLREWMSKPSTEEDGIIPRPPLLTFIPRCANGSIIWTTRSKRVATNIANARDIIPIEPMDTTQVVALVEKKLTTKQDHDDMIKLAEALEGMPLAIVQATAYIERRAPRCSVKQYLEELQKSDDQKQKLLNLEAGHRQRDWEARNSILATWQISFDHIQKIRPSAADLLSLMSFFDRQGIPEVALQNPPGDLVCLRNFLAKQGIVNHMASVPQDTYNTSLDDASKTQNLCCNDSFEDDITVLREYSFISLTQDLKIFQMHRLVQLATRSWLAAYGEADIWQAHFLWNIQREFRTGDNSRWVKCQSLFPHVKAAMSQRPRLKVAVKKWACLLISGAQYASWSGNTSEMMRMALKANEETERLLGSEHEYSMAAREMLALAYADAGKLREAESLQLGILEIYKRTLGEKHQNYVSHMHSLANTYQRQGRLQDATSLKIRALEIRKNTLGDDDPLTLKLLGSLASTYLDHDLLENAGSLNVQYLEKAKKMLGEEHPDVIAIMENLAITYFRQGRLHDAEILELQTVEACKKVLGESHSHTIRCMSNLAGHRRDRGWLLKAPDRPL